MPKGKIKKLIRDRGFGFIDADGKEIFFHQSNLEGVAFNALTEEEEVEFEVEESPKGPRAVNVKVVS